MPSLLTQSIGQAVATAIPNTPQVQPRDQSQEATHGLVIQQIAQAAQAESGTPPKVEDNKRAPQVPKRVESTYNSKGKKKAGARNPPEEEEKEPQDGVDLKA